MAFTVYILHSPKLKRFYVGYSLDVVRRLAQHRGGESSWTSRADDWMLVFTREVATESEAKILERKIKARGAGRFLANGNHSLTTNLWLDSCAGTA